MNSVLRKLTTEFMLSQIKLCTSKQIEFFSKLYGVKDKILTLKELIDNIPNDKIEHALYQIDSTLKKNRRKFFEMFDQCDIHTLHDVIFEAYYISLSDDEVIKLWFELPEDLQLDTQKYGMSDTVTKDNIYEHLTGQR